MQIVERREASEIWFKSNADTIVLYCQDDPATAPPKDLAALPTYHGLTMGSIPVGV